MSLGVATTVVPGTYTITEDGPVSEFDLSIECDEGTLEGSSLTVENEDDATCTLTNTYRENPLTTGTLVVEVEVTDGSDTNQLFDFSGSLGVFSLSDGGATSSDLTASEGPFSVSQTIPAG